jgi:Rho-binding antiterminator
MNDHDDYTPIDCEQYSRYELAIMHRQRLRIAWRDRDGDSHLENLLPINLNTRNHAEYLLVRGQSGKVRELRLDRIIKAMPCDG